MTDDKLFEKTYGEEEDELIMKSEIKDRKKYQAYYNKMNEIEDVKYNFNLFN